MDNKGKKKPRIKSEREVKREETERDTPRDGGKERKVRLPEEAKLGWKRGSSETDENNEDFSVRKDLQNRTSVIKI